MSAGNVAIAKRDVLDRAAVRAALEPGFDFRHRRERFESIDVVTEGMRAVIAGMKESGIARLLGVSGTAEMPDKTFLGKLTITLLKATPVGHSIRDHDGAFAEVKRSGLKWMLAGCQYIKDGPRRGNYRTSRTLRICWSVN
jgi:hypothetical protein